MAIKVATYKNYIEIYSWNMNKHDVYLSVSIPVTLTVVLLLPSFESSANATDRTWRYNEHGRNIDVEICLRCTQPGPQGPKGETGEQGPQGIQGEQGPSGSVENLKIKTTPRISEQMIIQPGANDFATASCNSNEILTGGGCVASPGLEVVSDQMEGDGSN